MRPILALTAPFLFSAMFLHAQVAADRSSVADARETLQQSLNALRSTYTADIEFDAPELSELATRPTISYKQRVFEDGSGDIQADLEHFPLPEDAPPGLNEISAGFLHTAEGNALRLANEAVMRDGQGNEDDPIAQMLNQLNEIPIPSDEELAAMDLRQDTEIIDGVECQVLSWIPKEYDANDPKSVAMHCVAFGAEDHILRSYTALNDQGEEMFALNFKNVNTNPSFGPDDFTFGPNVKVTHVDNDKDFENEVKALFMKKFLQATFKPKGKRRRHTASVNQPPQPQPEPEPTPEPDLPEQPPPPEPFPTPEPAPRPSYGKFAVIAGILLALLITGLLIVLQRKRSQ